MSSVFLSFGPKSGFLIGHTLNSMIECQDSPPTWYAESMTGLLPNVVFYDNAKSVHLYEDYSLDFEKDGAPQNIQKLQLPKDGPVQMPLFKPTPFIEYIKKGGATFLPLDQPRPNFKLEESTIAWCDIVNFNMSRRSFVEIPGTDLEPMTTYANGFARASDTENYDDYTDPIRRQFENCDRVGSVIFSADRNNGYGGFCAKLSEYVQEETPKAVRFVFSTAEDVPSDEIACNASLATAAFLEFADIHTLLVPPANLPNIIDQTKYKADNDFSRMALLSMPLTTALIPLLNNTCHARKYKDTIAPSSILKFTSLDACFPTFDELNHFSFPAEDRILTSFVTTCGTGNAAPEIVEKFKPDSPYFFDHASSSQPLFIGFNAPHFFKDDYVTREGMKPSQKPASLSDADYQRLVAAGVIKPKVGVKCEYIRALSAAATISTSKSLAVQLENTVNFIRGAPAIQHDIAQSDCSQMIETVLNIVDGLRADE